MEKAPEVIQITVKQRMSVRRLTKALAKTFGYTPAQFIAVMCAAEPVPVDKFLVVIRDQRTTPSGGQGESRIRP